MKETLEVDFPRLQADIEKLATIGKRADYGLYRMAFSEGELEARKWFESCIREAGLDVHVDGAANMHGRYGWRDDVASVMMGSHMDTVPGAGPLDGALGVMVALECARRFRELNIKLARPVEAVAFSDEEGRFGGIFGSQAMCGQITPEFIYHSRDLDNIKLTDAMAACGYHAMDALRAQRHPESIYAFVELHIEQGPILDREGISVGIVDAIAGLFKWEVTLTGEPNHAGTTPMNLRRDALQGVAELSMEINRLLEEHGSPRSVATIGRIELSPGAANVVPGKAVFSLEVRDTDARVIENLSEAFNRTLAAIARRRGLMFQFEILSEIEPVHCDPGIIDVIERVTRQLDTPALRMPSGAAHDTQIMARHTRAGMIFVPSKGGRSHSPAEWTSWDDIKIGANIAINTLYQLASQS